MSRRQKPFKPLPTGTAVGWSFFSSTLNCWRYWFLKYELGLTRINETPPDELVIGTIYHALLDGTDEGSIKSWGDEYVKHYKTAKDLFDFRTQKKAPPLPKPISSEETISPPKGHALEGRYTSKPDRIEREGVSRIVREFKTSGFVKDTEVEAAKWNVHGEVIGEAVCADTATVIVDVISKGEKPKVSQYEVEMNDAKINKWTCLILDLISQIKSRLSRYESQTEDLDLVFPCHLTNCTAYTRKCKFYDYCHGTSSQKTLFVKKTPKPHDWKKFLL